MVNASNLLYNALTVVINFDPRLYICNIGYTCVSTNEHFKMN